MPTPERLTPLEGNNQLLYFTSTSLLADDAGLVYLSDRTGHPNLFYFNLATREDRPLTHNAEGYLKSYVYFAGTPYRGFGKASVSLDAERGIAYYLQGRELRAVEVQTGKERTLALLPEGQMTAFTHVSADGARLCVPTIEARALDGENPLTEPKPDYDIDARVQAEGLTSYLRVYDTASGRELLYEPVPRGWVTHVQFSPVDPELIVYNHEWPADCGIRRMWLWDGHSRQHRRLRTEDQGGGRHRLDWTCHEMWERDGSAIIYHGKFHEGPGYLGRLTLEDGAEPVEIPFPDGWKQYGHFTTGRPGQLVSDGYYRREDTPARHGGAWLTELAVDWSAARIHWRPLLEHGSSWTSQDAHPHPILDHACRYVYFTSDREGARGVYRVEL
jgi:hypothetical protein